jgi:hypothetical protein
MRGSHMYERLIYRDPSSHELSPIVAVLSYKFKTEKLRFRGCVRFLIAGPGALSDRSSLLWFREYFVRRCGE